MSIFSFLKNKLISYDKETNLLNLMIKKNNNFQEIFNSNIFSKILRTQAKEIFYKKSNVLVLAPHPDDEVIGCGGSIEILQDKKSKIQIIYMTNGVPKKKKNYLEEKLTRKKEAINLNNTKNYQTPIFFDLETRKIELGYNNKILELKKIIGEFKPDIIFVPFLIDRVEDHVSTNKLLYSTLEDLYYDNCEIFSYQISNFIKLNSYVNITEVFSNKVQMMKFYKSVLKKTNYINFFKGLNLYNNFYVKDRSKEQEQFYEVFLNQSVKEYLKICKIVF